MVRKALSREHQALQSLLESDEDDHSAQDHSARRQHRSSRSSPSTSFRGIDADEYTPAFRLRDAPRNQTTETTPTDDVPEALVAMFSDSGLPTDIIKEVYIGSGRSQEAAIDALLAMTSFSPNADENPPPENTQQHTKQPPATCYWSILPTECKLLILHALNLRDLARAAGTSKEFAAHVRSQRSLLSSIVIPPGLRFTAITSLITAFKNATAVDFSRYSKNLRFPHDFVRAAEAVEEANMNRSSSFSEIKGTLVDSLSFSKCENIRDGDVAEILSMVDTLKRLDVGRCGKITDASLGTIAQYRRGTPQGSSSTNILSQEDNALHILNDATELVRHFEDSASLSSVQTATVNPLESPRSAVGRVIAEEQAARQRLRAENDALLRNSPGGIEHVSIAATGVSTKGVANLLRGSSKAPFLQSLDISRCPKVTGEALSGAMVAPNSMLRVLRASACSGIRSIVLQLPAASSMLSELHLTNCRSLQELRIQSAPSLLDLNISGCPNLHTLSLRCPRLHRLTASGCSKLAFNPLHIGPFAENPISFECPLLMDVNFFGCRVVDSAGFEAIILPSTISLHTLNLSGCTSISRIIGGHQSSSTSAINNSTSNAQPLGQLRELHVDGCSVLRILTLSSPALEVVSAKGCSRLMEMNLYGAQGLKKMNIENCAELSQVTVGGGGMSGGWVARKLDEDRKGKPRLVMKGCERLSQRARDELRKVVLGGLKKSGS